MLDRKSAQKEKSILAAARQRFAYYGYSKTTMDEIAGDVGLGKASLYYYYPTKESLFRAVIRTEQQDFLKYAEVLLRSTDHASDKLRAYVKRRIEFFQRAVVMGKFNLQTYAEIKPIMSDIMKDFASSEHRIILQIMEAGTRDGEFEIVNLHEVSHVFLYMLQGLRLRIFNTGVELPPRDSQFEALRHETGIAVDIFLRGITAAPGQKRTTTHA